jgi:hypothetical protein
MKRKIKSNTSESITEETTVTVESTLTTAPSTAVAPDPFDVERLRMSQDFSQVAGVEKLITTIPVRKPANQDYVRTHPDEAYRIITGTLEVKEDRETYLVDPDLLPQIATEVSVAPRLLVTSINRQGTLFLWQVRMPGLDGRTDSWGESGLQAVKAAEEDWVRVVANMSLGGYDIYRATAELSEPDWPDMAFGEILRTGFRNRVIDDYDHPVLRRLRGEI